jgi:iron complex outermembrane receptor protein
MRRSSSARVLLGGSAIAALASAAFAQSPATDAIQVSATGTANNANAVERVLVTARRREEDAQMVPVSLSVIDMDTLDKTSTYNIQQLTQLAPSLNYTSPNPRNTALTIRGLGSSVVAIAQANDGLEQGVGFYVDQVYHGRPATAAFDFVDLERVEVLRGPQGTLFGKNTTAGAINITTRAPTFEREIIGEVTGGTIGFFQAKAALSGAVINDVLAARVSVAYTKRDGVIENVTTGEHVNTVNNIAARGQLLYRPNEDFRFTLSTDYSAFDSNCCTQVFVRVAPTLKPPAQQYSTLAAGKNYAPASFDPYERKTDIDANLAVDTSEGGVSGTSEWNLGPITLTSVSAWRWWNWDAANDRDYTSLIIQTVQHIPSRQIQYSQEFRIASNGVNTVDYVAGVYWFQQTVKGHPFTEYGPDAAYWFLGPPPTIPSNLLEGYGTEGHTNFKSDSYAAFGEIVWHITDLLSLSPGLRYTYEEKHGTFESQVYGGVATTDPFLIARKLSILRPQSYEASVSDGSASGRVSLSYQLNPGFMAYGSYAQGYKSGGINMSGLPLNPSNLPALSTAVVEPERNTTYEVGVKTRLLQDRLLLNVDAFRTTVRDFQANVVDSAPGALRGYLANIDKVRVTGVELDSLFVPNENLSGHFSVTWMDGKYVSYADGPCPIERIGTSTTMCDLSGRPLTALPKWALSAGGEYVHDAGFIGLDGQVYFGVEAGYRSKTSGDPSASAYTVIDGYTIVNLAVGFRQAGSWEIFVWVKNLFDENYIQNLTVQAGNSGLIVGTPNDPRTIGMTLRAQY